MKLYTVKELSTILQVSEQTVRAMLKSGRLKGLKLKDTKYGKWRVTQEALDEYKEVPRGD